MDMATFLTSLHLSVHSITDLKPNSFLQSQAPSSQRAQKASLRLEYCPKYRSHDWGYLAAIKTPRLTHFAGRDEILTSLILLSS